MNKATEPGATKTGAIDQTKIAAINMGGTSISNLQCSKGGLSLLKN